MSDGSLKIQSGQSSTTTTSKQPRVHAEDASSIDLDSTDDDSASESEEESMQPPLPATRPTRAIEVVKYDTIKSLWRVPYRSATDDDIRKGLAEFGDIVRTIRDRWKTDLQAVKDAEEAKKENELPLLNERVAIQRDMLEAAVGAAVSEGHKDIIEQYVSHAIFFGTRTPFCWQFHHALRPCMPLKVLSFITALVRGDVVVIRISFDCLRF